MILLLALFFVEGAWARQGVVRHENQQPKHEWLVPAVEPPQQENRELTKRDSHADDRHDAFEQQESAMKFWRSESYQRECQPTEKEQDGWAKYKAFHSRCRTDRSCMKKALIWSCKEHDWCGGLGDEIKGLTFTLYAAIASARPFFIVWEKAGQDILQLFSKEGIDVRLPAKMSTANCKRSEHVNSLHTKDTLQNFMDTAQADYSKCLTWVTNFIPAIWFLDHTAELRHRHLPWFEHIKPIYAVGCAMRFLFASAAHNPTVSSLRPSSSPRWPAFLSKLPQKYAVIHFRVPDSTIMMAGDDGLRNAIEEALKCTQVKAKGLPLVFLAGSQAAKDVAFNITNGAVMLTKSTARHLDHDHERLSLDELIGSVFEDFWTIMGAEYLFAGRRFSGLSLTAASIGFMPQEHVLDPHCKASWVQDDFEGLGMP
mmetsp:Transcript_29324/g.53226  ORF Transcript_29324/g.53226 Transcript_29324/m.53226 type:complete len:427 (-) Transcript_29324:117-1397(-)